MEKPTIAFAGMTHLGLVSAAAVAEKGFQVTCYDMDPNLVTRLETGELPIVEPELPELLKKNKDSITFTVEAKAIEACDIIIISPDVATNDQGDSDLTELNLLLKKLEKHVHEDAVQIILSQVPPGFTRKYHKSDNKLFYQVETLIFGRAVERALYPERIIIGCADPSVSLPDIYKKFLNAFDCPLLSMGYESAELAKISINCCLVSSISVANTLAELCEQIGADWSEIVPALKLDARIGEKAYLAPGLGLSGGNLERDLATVMRLADRENTNSDVIKAWLANSQHRKDWAYSMLEKFVFSEFSDPRIAVLGLAYKENTHSTKNSPSLVLLSKLGHRCVRAYDPVVKMDVTGIENAPSVDTCITGADVVVVMTPWDEFKKLSMKHLALSMAGHIIIDPYCVFDPVMVKAAGLCHVTLGASSDLTAKES